MVSQRLMVTFSISENQRGMISQSMHTLSGAASDAKYVRQWYWEIETKRNTWAV